MSGRIGKWTDQISSLGRMFNLSPEDAQEKLQPWLQLASLARFWPARQHKILALALVARYASELVGLASELASLAI